MRKVLNLWTKDNKYNLFLGGVFMNNKPTIKRKSQVLGLIITAAFGYYLKAHKDEISRDVSAYNQLVSIQSNIYYLINKQNIHAIINNLPECILAYWDKSINDIENNLNYELKDTFYEIEPQLRGIQYQS